MKIGVVDVRRVMRESFLGQVAQEVLSSLPAETSSQQMNRERAREMLKAEVMEYLTTFIQGTGHHLRADLILDSASGVVLWTAVGDLTEAVMHGLDQSAQQHIEKVGRERFIADMQKSLQKRLLTEDPGPPGNYL